MGGLPALFRTQQVASLAFAAGILAGCVAAAQAPISPTPSPQKPTPVLTVNARIVILDVVVTDKAGHLVPGLTRGGFTIYEDQTRQTIRSFETPEQHVLPPGVSIDSTLTPGGKTCCSGV